MLCCYSLLQWLIESHTNVSRLTVCAYVRVCVRLCICKIQLLFAIENRMCVCLCMFVFWSANWNWTSVWCSLFILSPHSALFNCTTIWWTIRLAKITNKQTFTPHYFFGWPILLRPSKTLTRCAALRSTLFDCGYTHSLPLLRAFVCHCCVWLWSDFDCNFFGTYYCSPIDSYYTFNIFNFYFFFFVFVFRYFFLLFLFVFCCCCRCCFCCRWLHLILICVVLNIDSLFSHQNENKGYAQRKKCVEIINDMYIHP